MWVREGVRADVEACALHLLDLINAEVGSEEFGDAKDSGSEAMSTEDREGVLEGVEITVIERNDDGVSIAAPPEDLVQADGPEALPGQEGHLRRE
jgi:hypothetical protein